MSDAFIIKGTELPVFDSDRPFQLPDGGSTIKDSVKGMESLVDFDDNDGTAEALDAWGDKGADADGDEQDNAGQDLDGDDDESNGQDGNEDNDESGEEDQPEETYKVTLPDGEEAEVTLAELTRGYSRQADYTKKTQALAETRRAIDAEKTTVASLREAYGQRLDMIGTVLQSALGPEQLAAVEQEYVRVRSEAAELDSMEMQRAIAEESSLLIDAIPEWKNPDHRKQEKTALLEYARGLGFTDDQLSGVVDHRLMVILRNSMKYEQGRARRKEIGRTVRDKIDKAKTKTLQPSGRPRVSPNTGKRKEFQRRDKQFKQTGTHKDAARLFEMFVEDL